MDLRTQSSQSHFRVGLGPLRRQGSMSASIGLGEPNQRPEESQKIPFQSLQLQPHPSDESMYKWKLSDNGHGQVLRGCESTQSLQHCHRIEYLPCDGICADEVVSSESTNPNPDSARSTSSRTSRGCNTDETRIFPERLYQSQSYHSLPPASSTPNPISGGLVVHQHENGVVNGNGYGHEEETKGKNGQNQKNQSIQTQKIQPLMSQVFYGSNPNYNLGGGGDNGIIDQMRNMNINQNQNGGIKCAKAHSNCTEVKVGGGDFPHALGKVPK